MKTQRKKGFTMVELVIVIAVIAILAAVLIPTFVNLTKKANEAAALADARNIANQILADMLKGGGKDILVFEQKGDELYIHGYCAEAGRVLAYRYNPVKIVDLEGDTLAKKVENQLNTMAEKGEVVPAAVPSAEDWWSSEKMATAAEELGYSAETTVLRADYQIVPVNFTKDETPVDEVHNCKESLTHYEGQPANCTQAGYDKYWICNKCGKMYGTGDATGGPLTKINVIPPTGHTYVNGVCSVCGAKEPSNGGNNGGNTNPTPAPTPTETTNPTEPSTAEPTELSTEPEQTEEEKLIATVNAALAADASRNGNPKTMHDAMTAIGTYKTQVQAAGLLWDSVKNEFCTETEVTERLKDTTRKKYEFWKIVTTFDSNYSNYLADNYSGKTDFKVSGNGIKVGVDVGNNTNITSITILAYNASDAIVVRTKGGTLNVHKGAVTHYGVADEVVVGRSKRGTSTSYIENGEVKGLIEVYGSSNNSVSVTINVAKQVAKAVVISYSAATVKGNSKTPICYTTSKPSKVTNPDSKGVIGPVCLAGVKAFDEGFGTQEYPFVISSTAERVKLDGIETALTIYAKLGGNYTEETTQMTIARNAKIVLDLNGHTITLKSDATIQVGAQGLTIKDSGSNGGITKSEASGTRGLFASFADNATITIEGGTFNGNYLVGNGANAETSITITVKGGNFILGNGFVTTGLTKATLSIQGGTFNLDPTAYAGNNTVTNNGNGTWTVTLN